MARGRLGLVLCSPQEPSSTWAWPRIQAASSMLQPVWLLLSCDVELALRTRYQAWRWLCARGTRRGGGGNRTRVLQRFGESSPSAVAGELSGGCGQRHPASRRSRLCVSPPPRRHGRRASPADDGTGARRTGATGPNSQPEIRLRAPDRLDRRWRLYLFPALFRGSGDHGSLLSLQPSKSKPITPKVVAEATLCGSRSAGYHPSCRFA